MAMASPSLITRQDRGGKGEAAAAYALIKDICKNHCHSEKGGEEAKVRLKKYASWIGRMGNGEKEMKIIGTINLN